MSDFFHDPTTDDSGDTFVIHTADGLTIELCPSCLTVRSRGTADTLALARVPLNLDRIEGVAAGSQVTAHATHAHLLTVRREPGGLDVRVSTPHLEVLRRHLPIPPQVRPAATGRP
jgi:hypothetical protein